MTAYLIVMATLFILALTEHDENQNTNGKWACGVLIAFAGLRYETGFDWMAYEDYFELTSPIWSSQPQYLETSLLVEPGFAFFTLIVRSLGLNFQAMLFIIALLNMYVIYRFSERYTNRTALVFLVYFGFVFLAGQMAAIRQTMSYSFLLLAFMRRDSGYIRSSLALALIAVSIHTFSIVFLPLIYLRIPRLPVFPVMAVVAGGLGAAINGFHIVPIAADTLLPLLGAGFLGTKLSLYGDYTNTTISLVSLMFVPLHLATYFLLTTERFKLAKPLGRLTYFAMSATLLSLISHSYLGLFPAFWNRVSYLTFLLQIVALTFRYREYLAEPTGRLATVSASTIAGASILIYTLNMPTSLPFTPYQNVALAWVTGDYGDGRFRYVYAFQRAESEIAERKR